jgi:hypothetical protein
MVEGQPEVVVDEAISEVSGKSYLKVVLVLGGCTRVQIDFYRGASPSYVSRILNETGCYIKYDDEITLSEKDKQTIGDLYIEASYNVPGVKK